MASVTVDSGEFPLFRNIDASHQPSRSKVYTAWLKAFEDMVPSALDRLAEVVEDVYTYKLWEERRLSGPEEFLKEFGITGLNLDDPAKLIRELRKKDSSVKRKLIKRISESKRLVNDEGLSLRKAAEVLGVNASTVMRDVLQKDVIIKKCNTVVLRYQITGYTQPSVAAEKIRTKFGDEFALALKQAL